MKNLIALTGLAMAGLVLAPSNAAAEDLLPGSAAPKIAVKNWVKGKAVSAFQPGKVYVVEFWATWCGPCIESIPHISSLAAKNKDVTFMGIGIWEENPDKRVEKFVKEMGSKMSYNVAYGGNQEGMAKTWMQASGSNGIPTAFIVKDKKVAWIGHPQEMDKPLAEIKSGKFNIKKAREAHLKVLTENKAQMETMKEMDIIMKLYKDGKQDEAKKKLEAVRAKYPSAAEDIKSIEFGWLAVEDYPVWEKQATAMVRSGDEAEINRLTMFAMSYSNELQFRNAVSKAAELLFSNADPGDFITYYYLMNIHRGLKNYDQAIKMADMAIAAHPKSEYKDSPKLLKMIESEKAEIAKEKK
jgi:thiol-disulfide isomerase/thioredoxin